MSTTEFKIVSVGMHYVLLQSTVPEQWFLGMGVPQGMSSPLRT